MQDTTIKPKYSQQEIEELKKYSYLGLTWEEIQQAKRQHNVLNCTTELEANNPGFREYKVMRDPQYLFWAAKVLLGITVPPYQALFLENLWSHQFPMLIGSRGSSKSFSLTMYMVLRSILIPGTKAVCVGSAFRQSKILFEYMENMWNKSAILRSIYPSNNDGPRRAMDMYTMRFGDSVCMFVPLGGGDKIRGLRANLIVTDEFAALDPDVYETVVSGFAAVSKDPVERMKTFAVRKLMKELGSWGERQQKAFEESTAGNQSIISGTCDYAFGHFAEYWKRYKAIIEGTTNESDDGDAITEDMRKKYCIIRLPFELIPEGIMDEDVVARAKATMNSDNFLREYSTIFTRDSSGFFRRSLIESCTTYDTKPVKLRDREIVFQPRVHGDPNLRYVIGVDPASENDNFSIVILEMHDDHTRVVYCWTINRKRFKRRVSLGLTEENDYYGYCARKIRDLISVFPTAALAIDAQGGGYALAEALQDKDKMHPNEQAIYPIIEEGKEKDTDNLAGLHIIHLCQFANAQWTAEANHGMKKDMEDKALLFPSLDAVSLEMAYEQDVSKIVDSYHQHDQERVLKELDEGLYDTFEDCALNVEELKNELCTIIHTRTGSGVSGRERWDTPEVKTHDGKKGRMLKDRYSALVMANMVARSINRNIAITINATSHGIRSGMPRQGSFQRSSQLYAGPEWFTSSMRHGKPRTVGRRRGKS